MNIKHVGTGAVATLFTDVDNGDDYAVAQWDLCGWEHLYTIINLYDGQVEHNVDGATPEDALRNYLEHGQRALARPITLYCNGTPIERLDRPGCDTEYKVRGVPIVCTVKRGSTAFEWRVFEDGSNEGTTISVGSPAEAVLQYITEREGVVDAR